MSPSSVAVAYRPVGAGQKDRFASFDLSIIPKPRQWLEQQLGTLAFFEVQVAATTAALDDDATAAPEE